MTGPNHNSDTHSPENARPTVTFDYDLYARYLEDADLTEEQKHEFLQTLWNIIVDFVSLGFGVHPVQQAQNTCGKLPESRINQPDSAVNAVNCKGKFQCKKFNDAAEGIRSAASERIQE